MSHVPDFPPVRRGGGDAKTPDFPGVSVGKERGKYPADSGGPPQTAVGSAGPSGDPFEIKATPTPHRYPNPRPTPVADTQTNPLK